MALAPKKPDEPIEIIYDSSTGKKYEKGKFLGKGGFAKCFELKDLVTGGIFAGKIVSKSLLVKDHQKEKMEQEIRIHRSLDHKHIVSFHSFFDDKDNVYITLELCSRRSLMELHRRRKTVTEPETRYFMKQILEACTYLHDNKVIHRDLKLGNLFLNDEMEIKLGDFGLATKLEFDGERKRTLCGTPNYIAPEVLTKKGHSFEVDVWSIGCIMYTLLLGKPPFETSNLKDTYERIKKNEYIIPPGKLSASAAALIKKMLRAEPSSRPTVHKILEDEFFIDGICPSRLPTSCLTTAPRYDQLAPVPGTRRPLVNVSNTGVAGTSVQLLQQHAATYSKKDDRAKATTAAPGSAPLAQYDGGIQSDQPTDYYIGELHSIISALLAARPADLAVIREDESEDPASVPIYWVAKWVDYSDKYGLGYQLCDNSVGVLYNDSTRLLLGSNGDNLQYIERDGTEHLHLLRAAPESLTKKVTLLKYFRNYMSEHLLKAGANIVPREGDEMSRLPFLRTWFRTRSAIVIHLSNGTLQINFFQDHTKIIICPLMQAFTYIDEHKRFRTYKMDLVAKYGCSKDIATRLKYALAMVERILQSKSSGGMLRVATAPAAGASGPASDVACH